MRSAFAVAMLVVTLGVSISLAQPPKDHVLWFKVVGRVLDRNGLPIHWGRVYLKDTHSHLLRIRAVDNGGHFSLLGLDAQLDYEVYGEQDDLVSKKVLISGSKKTPEVTIELKLGTKQEIR
jgi:hypothetical protein